MIITLINVIREIKMLTQIFAHFSGVKFHLQRMTFDH